MKYYKLKTVAFYIFVGTIMFVNLKGSENENEWSCPCCNCLKKEKKYKNSVGNNVVNNVVNINTTNEENKNRKYLSKIIGLNNLGNSCYMNSILQVLVHTPDFIDYFLQNDFNKEEQPLSFALKNFFIEYYNNNKISFALEKLHNTIREKYKKESEEFQYGNGKQYMATTFLNQFLWSLEKENKKIIDFFRGKKMLYQTCLKCKNTFQDIYNFIELQLNINNKYLVKKNIGKDEITLEKLLDYYIKEMEWPTMCSQCKETTNMKCTNKMSFLPKYLILFLNLSFSCYNKRIRKDVMKKFNDFIEIPKELNLKKYCTEQNKGKFDYTLYGLVRHQGDSIESGHYTAAIKNRENWYRCNDYRVSLIEKPFPDGKTCSKNLAPSGTCLLFYKMKENESILPKK